MVHLSQMAEDLILWSTPEFAFVELPDALTTSSSLMPQKKNPDMIELVRARAAGVMGRLVSLLATLKALPLGYNRDLQETKPALFEVADVTLQSLHAMEIAFARMRINTDAMEAAAGDPGMLATDLAEYLVGRGVPFRDAHGAVARLMKWCADRGTSPASLTLPHLREHSPAFGEDVLGILTPRASVTRRSSPGGTSPRGVKQRIAELRGDKGTAGAPG
jgi:argininosuccinate lyase